MSTPYLTPVWSRSVAGADASTLPDSLVHSTILAMASMVDAQGKLDAWIAGSHRTNFQSTVDTAKKLSADTAKTIAQLQAGQPTLESNAQRWAANASLGDAWFDSAKSLVGQVSDFLNSVGITGTFATAVTFAEQQWTDTKQAWKQQAQDVVKAAVEPALKNADTHVKKWTDDAAAKAKTTVTDTKAQIDAWMKEKEVAAKSAVVKALPWIGIGLGGLLVVKAAFSGGSRSPTLSGLPHGSKACARSRKVKQCVKSRMQKTGNSKKQARMACRREVCR